MPQPRQGGLGVEGLPLMDDHCRVLVRLLHFLPWQIRRVSDATESET